MLIGRQLIVKNPNAFKRELQVIFSHPKTIFEICNVAIFYIKSRRELEIICYFSAPSKPPETIAVGNISSTALSVSWGLVPTSDRNGIVTQNIVYYKLQSSLPTEWRTLEVSTPANSTIIYGLKHWSFYFIKVAAKTNKVGVASKEILMRTDEDSEYGCHVNLSLLAYLKQAR